MNSKLTLVASLAALPWLTGTASTATETASPPALPKIEATRAEPARAMQTIQLAAEELPARAEDQFQAAVRQFEQAQRQIDKARAVFELAQAASGVAATAVPPPPPGEIQVYEEAGRYRDRMQTVIRRAPAGARSLVVRSAEGDPAAQTNLEDDLAVMLHLLDKSVEEAADAPRRTAMGINVMFAPGSNPVRSLYVDGYGALFLLRVNFPLIAPPKTAEEPKEKPAADSSWEEARRELYGQPDDAKVPAEMAAEFDADQVARLKDSLFAALKSATNIRGLKSDDAITVCVTGGTGAPRKYSTAVRAIPTRTVRVAPAGSTVEKPPPAAANSRTGQVLIQSTGSESSIPRGTILTIRVRKSDVDAFSKGRITLDEFRRRATVATYRSNLESGGVFGGGGGFGGGGFGSSGTGGFGAAFGSSLGPGPNFFNPGSSPEPH